MALLNHLPVSESSESDQELNDELEELIKALVSSLLHKLHAINETPLLLSKSSQAEAES
jgi:hypothetical protein